MSSQTDRLRRRQAIGEGIRKLHSATVRARWLVEQMLGTTSDTKVEPQDLSAKLEEVRVIAEKLNGDWVDFCTSEIDLKT